MIPKLTDLTPFFSPQSVAIVGASQDPIRLGGRPLEYMSRYRFAGRVYPVSPKHAQIQGLAAYPSLTAVSDDIELAIIAVPSSVVESVILEGIAKGVKAFIVFSSGYAEMGDAGREAQVRLASLCQAAGVLLLGPNCMGCADTHSRLIASFSTAMETSTLKPGRFGLVTQSGALGSYCVAMLDRQGLGFSKFIATGNEAGVDLAQGIAYLADDKATDVIGVYIESIKKLPAFRQAALKAAQAGKTIVAIKAGRSQVGAEAAASHTGSLAGEDVNYQAFFDQFGIVRVQSLSEMIDTARLLIKQPLPAGRRVGIVTVSGGAGVLLADELETRGLLTPDFNTQTKAELSRVLPSFIYARNPLDHTAAIAGDPQLFDDVITIVGRSTDHDAYIVFSGLLDSVADKLVASLKRAFTQSTKQVGVIWLGASATVIDELEAAGIPVFADIPQAARAFENVAFAVDQRARVKALAGRQWPLPRGNDVTLTATPDEATVAATTFLTEHRAARRVQSLCDLPFPGQQLVAAAADFEKITVGLQYPLVAKLQSDAMPHRSEHGGVVLNLQSPEQVRTALETLFALAASLNIPCEGVLLQEMHDISVELIVGIKDDPLFGPLFVVGRGGIDVELRPDVRSAGLPQTPEEIKTLLLDLESADLLTGHRGRPTVDLNALADSLAALADGFLADDTLCELEINPLVVTGDGRVMALDALGRER